MLSLPAFVLQNVGYELTYAPRSGWQDRSRNRFWRLELFGFAAVDFMSAKPAKALRRPVQLLQGPCGNAVDLNDQQEFAMQSLAIPAITFMALSYAGTAEAGPFMAQKGPTLAPFAHVEFCLHTPASCAIKTGNPVVEMTQANADLIDNVNLSVNAAITPQEDSSQADNWQISPPSGDCNDYAVTKQNELVNSGLPTNAVRLAIAKTPEGIGHSVVVVRTSDGDMVLDNRTNNVTRWDQTDLTWLKVESSSDPKMWQRL